MNSPSRNAPCPCGSGKKYKRCCLQKRQALADASYPNTGLTRETLAEAYQLEAQNRFGEALPHYRKLLGKHPRHPALLWGLARSLMELKRRHEAADVLLQAVEVYPHHEKMVEDAITRLNILGKPERALKVAATAGKNFPANTNILLYESYALRVLGRDEEATRVLRRIIEREPDHPLAFVELVKCLRNMGVVKEALETAAGRLAQPDIGGLERGMLLNETAQIRDARRDYAEAFADLKESGKLVAASPEASRRSPERFLQDLAAFHDWVADNGLPVTPPDPSGRDRQLVFMVGFPRSGTTLLESMLASAKGVVTSDESALVEIPVSYVLSTGLADAEVLAGLATDSELLATARQKFWENLDREYGQDYSLFIDKQPMNTFNLAHIRLLFPGARIIFSIRDPRDVCLSCFFQWLGFTHVSPLFLDWRSTADTYARMMSYWFELEPHLEGAVCKLRYEDLVDDLRGEFKRVVQFLELPWDDELLAFTNRNQERFYTTPSNRAIKEKVNRKAVGRWKNYQKAIAEIEPVLAPMIERFGYSE